MSGQKPGRPKSEPTQPVSIRLTAKQKKKYLDLGGARWMKRELERANPKQPKEAK